MICNIKINKNNKFKITKIQIKTAKKTQNINKILKQ